MLEVKSGLQSSYKRLAEEFEKDLAILSQQSGEVFAIEWHFLAGAQGKLDEFGDATASFGMTKRITTLLEEAKSKGVEIVMHVPQ